MRQLLCGVLFCGIPVSAAGMLAAACLLTVPDVSASVYRVCAGIPLLCGGFCAGFRVGKRNRHFGLLWGMAAGALLTAFWYIFVRLLLGTGGFPVILPAVCLFAMCGGAVGVNRREPEPARISHRRIRLREQFLLRIGLLHRPAKIEKEYDNSTGRSSC